MSAITLREDELQAALRQCDEESAVAMLLSHRLGLRVAEIAAARWEWVLTATVDDVGEVCRVPAVSTKGCLGAGTLPLADDLREALRVLWASRHYPTRGPIVRTLHGSGDKHVSPGALRMRLKECYIAAGMPHASSHSGRRSLGTAAAREMNLPSVMGILRHSDLTSTLRYVQVADDATVANFIRRRH